MDAPLKDKTECRAKPYGTTSHLALSILALSGLVLPYRAIPDRVMTDQA